MNPDDKITDLQLAKLRKNTDVGLWTGNALQELQERRAADEEEENVKKLLRRFVRYHDDDSDCAWTGEGYFDRLMREGVAFLNGEVTRGGCPECESRKLFWHCYRGCGADAHVVTCRECKCPFTTTTPIPE